MEAFGTINSRPLFVWLSEAPLSASWWLWASVAVTALMAANTLLCSIDSLLRKRAGRSFLMVASPQVIHLGVVLLLFAHLVSASAGFTAKVIVRQGEYIRLPEGERLVVHRVWQELSSRGMPLAYGVEGRFLGPGGAEIKSAHMEPNSPAFFDGMGFYVKQVRGSAAMIEVTREPGAPFALAGGVLFFLGTVALVGLKVKRER